MQLILAKHLKSFYFLAPVAIDKYALENHQLASRSSSLSLWLPRDKYETLSDASQREVCKGSGIDISARLPANLSQTRLKSSRKKRTSCSANDKCLVKDRKLPKP